MEKIYALNKKAMLIFACLFSFQAHVMYGQLYQTQRVDFTETDIAIGIKHILPLGQHGVCMLVQNEASGSDLNKRWRFVHLDTNLAKTWEGQFKFHAALYFKTFKQQGNEAYLLFGKYDSYDNVVYKWNTLTGEIEIFNIYPILAMPVEEFEVVGNDVYLLGMVNYKPVIIHYDMQTRRSKVLPSLYEPNSEVNHISTDALSQRMYTVMVSFIRDNKTKLYLKSYKPGGYVAKGLPVAVPSYKHPINLTSGIAYQTDSSQQKLLGTFAGNFTEFPQGIYMGCIDTESKESKLKLVSFSDFNNFFNHLPAGRKRRLDAKIAQKKAKGKAYKMRYRFFLHKPVIGNEKITIVAEAYFPQYHTELANGLGFSRMPTYRIFDGYRYTHFMVCSFDKAGQLLWNNSFKTSNQLLAELNKTVHYIMAENDMVLAFVDKNKIIYEVLENGKASNMPKTLELHSNGDGDKVSLTRNLGINQWYANNFIAWGNQEISNRKQADAPLKTRTTFFLAKTTYTPVPQNVVNK